jgi:hypothetical protein
MTGFDFAPLFRTAIGFDRLAQLTQISHTPRATRRRYPTFESKINVLQEVDPRSEGNSLFLALPVRYGACAVST